MRRSCLILLLLGFAPLFAQQPPDLRGRMAAFVDAGDFAGVVTLVGTAAGVTSHEAVGFLDIDAKSPLPKDAIFRIASMTKPVTAVGVMVLADEGKLSVDDPVEKHLPEFRGQMLVEKREGDRVILRKSPRPITLRDLLTHTSGLPGAPPPGLADLYPKRNRTLAEGVIAFSQRPLEFEPGTKWAYCNTGIDALGRVIEVVSGQPYEQFLQARILGPLGMADTTFTPTAEQVKRVPPLYEKKAGRLTKTESDLVAPGVGAKYPLPMAGLYSTAADLAKFYRMMLNRGELDGRRILSESAVAEMTKVQTGDLKTGFVPGMGFGLGWGVVREPQGVTERLSPGSYGHGGAFGTQGWIDPKRGTFVVLLVHRVGLANADASPLRIAMQEVAFGNGATR